MAGKECPFLEECVVQHLVRSPQHSNQGRSYSPLDRLKKDFISII